ncbi:MAG: hypothetical protein K8W52_04005 [Deltaproteobacteria bacterium]|nr:hypothetical protein [Deltaproteobacteria bacterium]
MPRALLALVMFVTVLAAAAAARADVPDEAVTSCNNKQVGDSCDEPAGGACAMQKCSRARPGPDGHIESNEWDCLRCDADAPRTDAPGNTRIILGVVVGLALAAGGIWLALRKRPA